MKRAIIAAILGVAGSVATTYGQGIVQFNNYISHSFNPVVQTGGANVDLPTVEVALFYVLGNATGDTTSAFLTAAGSPVSTGFIDTTLNTLGSYGGTGPGGYYDSSTVATLASWTTSQTATFMVEAWNTAAGGTFTTQGNLAGTSALWTEVVDSGYASSTLTGYGIIPTSLGAPSEPMFTGMPTLTMALNPVPEPTTLALAGLGGAALLALRRKKA
jgi:hypothetical protein